MRNTIFAMFAVATIAGCMAETADDSYLEDGPPDGKADAAGAYMSKVNDHLWRGSQPDERWIASLTDPAIREIPFRSVVNLRAETNSEAPIVQRYGMTAEHIPIVDHDFPTDDQLAEFLEFATLGSHQPVYVHCNAGKGRTGVMVGAYRMAVDGWTAEQAYEEARSFGVSASKLTFFQHVGRLLERGQLEHYPATR